MVNSYQDNKLEDIDKKLVRGVYLRNIKDFKEDYDEQMLNKTLLDRLKEDMRLKKKDKKESKENSSRTETK